MDKPARILLLGVNARLGHALLALRAKVATLEWVGCTRAEVDLLDRNAIAHALEQYQPTWVINVGAYTQVAKAEELGDPYASELAVNTLAPGILGEEAHRRGVNVLQISTDFVFNGRLGRAYHEEDEPAPESVYGQSKYLGERALLASGAKATVVRVGWLHGAGEDFPSKILTRAIAEPTSLAVVDIEWGVPSSYEAFALWLIQLLESSPRRALPQPILHYCETGPVIHRYALAKVILERALTHQSADDFVKERLIEALSSIRPLSMTSYRPSFCPLDTLLSLIHI